MLSDVAAVRLIECADCCSGRVRLVPLTLIAVMLRSVVAVAAHAIVVDAAAVIGAVAALAEIVISVFDGVMFQAAKEYGWRRVGLIQPDKIVKVA